MGSAEMGSASARGCMRSLRPASGEARFERGRRHGPSCAVRVPSGSTLGARATPAGETPLASVSPLLRLRESNPCSPGTYVCLNRYAAWMTSRALRWIADSDLVYDELGRAFHRPECRVVIARSAEAAAGNDLRPVPAGDWVTLVAAPDTRCSCRPQVTMGLGYGAEAH